MKKYSGIVGAGEKRAELLGFPTVNIPLGDATSGIYAARVIVAGKEYHAAVYADQRRKLLEAHLLDFSGDVYGEKIIVELLKKIRDDKRFTDDEALHAAIGDDISKVRTYFGK